VGGGIDEQVASTDEGAGLDDQIASTDEGGGIDDQTSSTDEGGGIDDQTSSTDEGGGIDDQTASTDEGGGIDDQTASTDEGAGVAAKLAGKIIIGPPIIIDCSCGGRRVRKSAKGRRIPKDPTIVNRPSAAAVQIPPDRDEIPNIRMQAQEQTQWCWAAVAGGVDRSVAQASDIEQCHVAHKLLKFTDICRHKAVYNTPQSLKATLEAIQRLDQAYINQIASFEQIQAEIAARRPVCARIAWDPLGTGFEDGAHFVTIVGWEIRNNLRLLKVCDPWSGSVPEGAPPDATPVEVSYDEFRIGYNDVGKWVATYFVKELQ
jgi:hypothetical protein